MKKPGEVPENIGLGVKRFVVLSLRPTDYVTLVITELLFLHSKMNSLHSIVTDTFSGAEISQPKIDSNSIWWN